VVLMRGDYPAKAMGGPLMYHQDVS